MIKIACVSIFAVATALFLAACSPLQAFNAVSAPGASSSVARDVPYGEEARQRLDIYRPTSAAPAAGWPLVVFFYGGSWSSGRRQDYAFVGKALADRGIEALVADYRLYPAVSYPDFMNDSARALGYAFDEAQQLGADPARIFVMGHSAGGYNAAMLALDPRWLAAVNHSPRELAGWIGLSGAYDFLPTDDPELRAIFHAPDYPAGVQPITHLHAGAPRTFLGAPPDDKIVSYQRSTLSLAKGLQADGVSVTLKTYPHATHATLIGAFAWPLRWAGATLDDVVAFIGTRPTAH